MATLVLALDIATRTGVAFGSPGATPRCTTINFAKLAKTPQARLVKVKEAAATLARLRPALVVYEAPIGGQKVNQALIGFAAIMEAEFASRGIPVLRANLRTVRKHFLGREPRKDDFPGQPEAWVRDEIKRLVVRRCRAIGYEVADDDQADAAAIWDWACVTEFKAPAKSLGGLFLVPSEGAA